ncbi:MAG: hypothetical protein R3B57_02475 [Phycisphaerales bacterium]
MSACTRRAFLAAGPVGVLGATALASAGRAWVDVNDADTVGADYPTTPSSRAQEFVGASHARLERVQEMLAEDPGLAKASWDWGFGDWETAIGAASHTGRVDIIEVLIAHGARPTLFTMATLDQIDAVRAVLDNVPGAVALEGPHSIPLYNHARAGEASRVMEYLESKGLTPESPFAVERSFGETYFGQYAWGPGEDERFVVDWFEKQSAVSLKRLGHVSRNLMPVGEHEFSPAGARHVRVRFDVQDGRATRLSVPWSGTTIVGERV